MFRLDEKICSARIGDKKGFTLVEVVVVIVIIGILTGLTAPLVSGYVKRIELRNYVSTARLAEDTVMSLTGMQYAKVGNPIIGNPDPNAGQWDLTWSFNYFLDEATFGNQYIYVDSWKYSKIKFENDSSLNLMRVAPANLGAPGENRKSAGITEYKSRTGEEIPIETWIAHNASVNECEQRISQSIFVIEDTGNVTSNSRFPANYGQIKDGRYMRYERYGSWMFRTINDKKIVVLHNFMIKGSDNEGDIIEVKDFEDSLQLVGDSWYIYEFVDASYSGNRLPNGQYPTFTSSYKFIGVL